MKKQAELLAAIDAAFGPSQRPAVDVHGLLTDIVRSAVPKLGAPAVVRAKSVLRDRIAAMVEDNDVGDITPGDVRDVLGDMVDTLLDNNGVVAGAGISVSLNADGSVTVMTLGAAASMGIPSFVLQPVSYVAADDQFVAVIPGVVSTPRPSVLYFTAPDPLPRTDDPLYLLVNADSPAKIRTVLGADVATKDVTPGGLLQGVFAVSQTPPSPRFTLVEPLGIRPPPPPSPWWVQRVERAYPTPGALDLAELTAVFTAVYMQTGVRSVTYRATLVDTAVAGYVAVMVPVRYLPFQNGYPTRVGAFSPVYTELSRGHTIGGEEYAIFVLNVYLAGLGISGTFAIRPGAPA